MKSKKASPKKVSKKSVSAGKVALISAGVIAAGAAAYFLSDKKRRAKAKDWMVKMKDDAVKKFSSMSEMSKEMYHETIDKLADKYKNVRDASPEEIAKMVAEMKKHWVSFSKKAVGTKKKVVKAVKKASKKATKKSK